MKAKFYDEDDDDYGSDDDDDDDFQFRNTNFFSLIFSFL